MEGLNKLISLFLGLIVVVLFFAIVTGRINLKDKFFKLGGRQTKISPTTSPKLKITTIKVTSETSEQPHLYQEPSLTPTQKYTKVTTIPSTGVPTIFLPIAFSSLLGGMFLRKKS
jgi:hypothetical protein